MTDAEILEEVYRRATIIATNGDANVPSQVRFKEFRDFIEREWQRQDHPLTKSDEGQMYNIHRSLEIDEDGTVKELK